MPEGVAPEVVSADGRPANPEDLLIAYALDIPYVGQHGDDQKRWEARFGDAIRGARGQPGHGSAPRASRQDELSWARGLADAVIAEASRRGEWVAVVRR